MNSYLSISFNFAEMFSFPNIYKQGNAMQEKLFCSFTDSNLFAKNALFLLEDAAVWAENLMLGRS